jgi:hypothetical protein
MKELWLAFRPDLSLTPHIWTHAVEPIYPTTNWRQLKSLLRNELEYYAKVAAIDSDLQDVRLKLVRTAEIAGFDLIELDEQLVRNTLTVDQYNELKKATKLPIGLTSVPDPALSFIIDKGGNPDFIAITAYTQQYANAMDYIMNAVYYIPVIAVLNYADPNVESSNPALLPNMARTCFKNSDALWFWGNYTRNPNFELRASQNYPLVRSLIGEQSG